MNTPSIVSRQDWENAREQHAPRESDQDAIKARGMEKAIRGLALIDKDLAGKDWIVGDFSLADPAPFYV
jgi:glutathione S-transferase